VTVRGKAAVTSIEPWRDDRNSRLSLLFDHISNPVSIP